MNNFCYNIDTKVYFGRKQLEHLSEMKSYGNKVLIVYGGGSIKRTGLYQKVCEVLRNNNILFEELGGVSPNPKIESVREGILICKKNNIDMILAIGGGSAIDCAKAIAAGVLYSGDVWDLIEDGKKIKAALPIFTILTIAATGSEMDSVSVISDMSRNLKQVTESDYLKPKMSILNPEYTFSVPKSQTAAGVADIFSHICECYFNNVKGAMVQTRFAEGLFRTCIYYGPIALCNPQDYEARANLMWTASMAINGIISSGAEVGWSVHPIEHELSAFYDITHGVGLAILTPFWMGYVLEKDSKTLGKFVEFGKEVWKIDNLDSEMAIAKESIRKTREFFMSLGLPSRLSEVNIDNTHFELMAKKAERSMGFIPLDKTDVLKILYSAL